MLPTFSLKFLKTFLSNSGIVTAMLAVLIVGISALAYQVIQPPPPKTCGSPDGPAVTAPRIKLRDGRHLAYKEHGVPKDNAKYKIFFVHGFDSCRHDSAEVIEDLGVYIVSYDRAGYGESDPNPNRTVKSDALDIEELADQLGVGSKFYVIGYSMGGHPIWGCLKYIPHRLAGAGLLAPAVNYWWPGFPANLSKEAYYQQLPQDQWAVRVAHYIPWLTYWWNTQKWFPPSAVIAHRMDIFSRRDVEVLSKWSPEENNYLALARQQGEYESLHRDMMVGFGTWEFDPLDLKNPFPNNEGSVHLWHGDEDRLVPVILQRYIVQRLPWIHYHELSGAGHMFPFADGMSDTIVKAVLTGDK
ncbi:AB hydrolase-1 domain-containing protein [Citrus sinensis]|uniref:AB hydrolase-1 domain-containing protein n=1 Tax=Citrus sinensis TaxID=2711 RepID=A0ACB8JZS7_CITSI|nr:AB hydrolase-1 domain-containing protein [Citrus sinensis]